MKVKFNKLSIIIITLLSFSCSHDKNIYREYDLPIPEGTSSEMVKIRTMPDPAMLYVDGKKIGKTPLKLKLWHGEKREVEIVALPLYKNQFKQKILVKLPAIPESITIYMDYKKVKVIPRPPIVKKPEKPKVRIVEKIIEKEVIKKVLDEKIVILPTIYFDYNFHTIKEKYGYRIKELSKMLIKEKNIEIHLYGYSDETGNKKYNQKLSLKRANAVKELFTINGIPESRIKTFGKGSVSTIDSDGHNIVYTRNRKVEIRLIPKEE